MTGLLAGYFYYFNLQMYLNRLALNVGATKEDCQIVRMHCIHNMDFFAIFAPKPPFGAALYLLGAKPMSTIPVNSEEEIPPRLMLAFDHVRRSYPRLQVVPISYSLSNRGASGEEDVLQMLDAANREHLLIVPRAGTSYWHRLHDVHGEPIEMFRAARILFTYTENALPTIGRRD